MKTVQGAVRNQTRPYRFPVGGRGGQLARNLVKWCIIKFTLRAESVLFFVGLSDGAVLLCHGEAGLHRRLQRVSGAAGCCCVDPVAL